MQAESFVPLTRFSNNPLHKNGFSYQLSLIEALLMHEVTGEQQCSNFSQSSGLLPQGDYLSLTSNHTKGEIYN